MMVKTIKNKLFIGCLFLALLFSSSIQAGGSGSRWLTPRRIALIAAGLSGIAGVAWWAFGGNVPRLPWPQVQPQLQPPIPTSDPAVPKLEHPTRNRPHPAHRAPTRRLSIERRGLKSSDLPTTMKTKQVEIRPDVSSADPVPTPDQDSAKQTPDPVPVPTPDQDSAPRAKPTSENALFDELSEDLVIEKSKRRGRLVNVRPDISIAQVAVADQFKPHAGGDASCGYQALKNSIILLCSLITQADDANKHLHNLGLIQEFFGEYGTWRNEVIRCRAMTLFNDYISFRLRNCLRPEGTIQDDDGFETARIRGIYLNMLTNYRSELVHRIFSGQTVDVNYDGFLAFLDHAPIPITDTCRYFEAEGAERLSVEAVQARLRDQDIAARYLDSGNLAQFNLGLSNLQGVIEDCKRRGQRINLDGEWATEGEIEQLIVQEPRAMGSEMFTLIGDTSLISPEHDWVPEWQKLQRIRDELENPAVRDYIHCFIIGTMSRSIAEGQAVERTSMGHWFALVAHKVRQKRYYYIADSTNHCRLYTEPLRRIIAALEGGEIVQQLRPTAEDLGRLEQSMREMLTRKDQCILDVNARYQEYGGNYEAFGGHEHFIQQMTAAICSK